jgi:fucose 4-O-acetylase-like acetyltransferase
LTDFFLTLYFTYQKGNSCQRSSRGTVGVGTAGFKVRIVIEITDCIPAFLSKLMIIRERIYAIDALKGLAILLVVFGHAFPENVINFHDNIVFNFIYSFHMPLFMFLAGAVAVYPIAIPAISYLKKKFLALAVPFISWYVFDYFVTGSYHSIAVKAYFTRVILSPDWGLWFLWILFLNYCLLVLSVKMEKMLGLYAFLVTFLIVLWFPVGILGIWTLKKFFFYFALGYLFMKYKNILNEYLSPIKYSVIVIFPLLALQWHMKKGFAFAYDVKSFFSGTGIQFLTEYVLYACSIAVAVSGIVCAYLFIDAIKKTFIFRCLCLLGGYTLDIYVLHHLFLDYGFGTGPTRIISTAIVALISSLLISVLVLRRIKILNMIFLGGRNKTEGQDGLNMVETFNSWRILLTKSF